MSICVHTQNSLENRGPLLFKAPLEVICFRHSSHNRLYISKASKISVSLLAKSVFRHRVEKPEKLQVFLVSGAFLFLIRISSN